MFHSRKNIAKKITTVAVFVLTTAAGAFATLGEGKLAKSSTVPGKSLLSERKALKPGVFTLKSGYNFRGNEVINLESEKKIIRLNTTIEVQKGNTTFIVPIKKNIIFDKLKIELGNRQFQSH
ncbi:MAG: hypothetical protein JST23_07805 [Bacteroidetes bacterium]|nr:hypothetical protein [Bacteroidota bacterium]